MAKRPAKKVAPVSSRARAAQQAPQAIQYDQFQRAPEIEDEVCILAAECLGDKAGEAFMTYLESITIRAVAGPAISNEHLRHMEGARWLVQVMQARIHRGHIAKAQQVQAKSGRKAN